MRRVALARAGAIAGISALDAELAHAGPSAMTNPRWLAVAVAGGGAATAALACAVAVACRLQRSATDVSAGDLAPAGFGRAIDAPPFRLLAAVMLVCQGAAHAALLAAGVPNRTGVVAGPAAHVVLAIVGAAIIWLAGRLVSAASASLARAVAVAVARLTARTLVRSRPPCGDRLAPRARGGAVRGRAPPLPA